MQFAKIRTVVVDGVAKTEKGNDGSQQWCTIWSASCSPCEILPSRNNLATDDDVWARCIDIPASVGSLKVSSSDTLCSLVGWQRSLGELGVEVDDLLGSCRGGSGRLGS